MLKASTPVVVLIISLLGGLENSTFVELNIVMLISLGVALASLGVALASLGELMFSWTGFTFQVLAIGAEASRLVLTGVILKKYKLDSLSTLYYVAPLCAVLNGVCCLYFEWSVLPWDRIFSGSFIAMLLLNGLVAFSLNIASVMLIAHTSALTLTLAGIVKDILLVFLSMAIFHAPVTLLQFLGYSVALLALNLHKEFKKNQALFDSSAVKEAKEATGPTKV
jgi:drug/metabolite transporter (DMT)-like permease